MVEQRQVDDCSSDLGHAISACHHGDSVPKRRCRPVSFSSGGQTSVADCRGARNWPSEMITESGGLEHLGGVEAPLPAQPLAAFTGVLEAIIKLLGNAA